MQRSSGPSQREKVKGKVMLTTTEGEVNALTLWMAAGAEGAPAPQGEGLPEPLVIFTHFSSTEFPQNEQAFIC